MEGGTEQTVETELWLATIAHDILYQEERV